jgi:hypothetical protein
MAYYLVLIRLPACVKCGEKATVRVHRSGSDTRGEYCTRHGNAVVQRMNAEEQKQCPAHVAEATDG